MQENRYISCINSDKSELKEKYGAENLKFKQNRRYIYSFAISLIRGGAGTTVRGKLTPKHLEVTPCGSLDKDIKKKPASLLAVTQTKPARIGNLN